MPRMFTLLLISWTIILLQEGEALINITDSTKVTVKSGVTSQELTCSYLPSNGIIEGVKWIKNSHNHDNMEVYSWFFLGPSGTSYNDLQGRATHNTPAGSAVLTIENVTTTDNGWYECQITESGIGTASASVSLTVTEYNGLYIDFDNSGNKLHDVSSVNATEGGKSIFVCKVEKVFPQPNITWSRLNGNLVSGEKPGGSMEMTFDNISCTYDVSKTLTITAVENIHSNYITYQCAVSGIALNGTEAKNVTVKFNEIPTTTVELPTTTSTEFPTTTTTEPPTTTTTGSPTTTFKELTTSVTTGGNEEITTENPNTPAVETNRPSVQTTSTAREVPASPPVDCSGKDLGLCIGLGLGVSIGVLLVLLITLLLFAYGYCQFCCCACAKKRWCKEGGQYSNSVYLDNGKNYPPQYLPPSHTSKHETGKRDQNVPVVVNQGFQNPSSQPYIYKNLAGNNGTHRSRPRSYHQPADGPRPVVPRYYDSRNRVYMVKGGEHNNPVYYSPSSHQPVAMLDTCPTPNYYYTQRRKQQRMHQDWYF